MKNLPTGVGNIKCNHYNGVLSCNINLDPNPNPNANANANPNRNQTLIL